VRRFRFGIGEEGREFNSVARLYALPVIVAQSIAHMLRLAHRQPVEGAGPGNS
jgi:hypothetical protein